MYKRIIVAVGEYPEWDAPLAYAIALAAQTEAELCLLRVLSVPFVASAPDMVASSTLAMDHVMQANEHLLAGAMTAAEQAGVSYTALFRWGAFPEVLLQSAEEMDSDLLIVGAPNCPGWRHPLSGYAARQLLLRARRPVLVVDSLPSLTYGAAYWPRVMAVHDDTAEGERVVDYAALLASTEGLELCVATVGSSQPGRRGITWDLAGGALSAAFEQSPQRTALATDARTVTIPRYDATMLLDVAHALQCDAIILKASHRGGWQRLRYRSMLRSLLARADLPVLLIPAIYARVL